MRLLLIAALICLSIACTTTIEDVQVIWLDKYGITYRTKTGEIMYATIRNGPDVTNLVKAGDRVTLTLYGPDNTFQSIKIHSPEAQ